MKKITTVLLAVLFAVCAWAQEVEPIRLAPGAMAMKEVAFAIEKVDVGNKSIADVVIQNDKRHLQVVAKSSGSTDVRVSGIGGAALYKVTVTNDLNEALTSLKRDLEDEFPELEVTNSNGKLKITGKISSVAKLKLKNKILKAYEEYGIMDLSSYRPTPEILLAMKKMFENADFEVVTKQPETWEPGVIFIEDDLKNNMLVIKGKVYSERDYKKIEKILEGVAWLKDPKNKEKDNREEEYKINYSIDVDIEDTTLQVDVVHIALTKGESERIGIDWESFVNGGIKLTATAWKSIAYANNAGTTRAAGNAVGAEGGLRYDDNGYLEKDENGNAIALTAALGLMAKDNVGHRRYSGFLTFKSNGSEPSKLHQGGKVWLQSLSTANNVVSSELKEVEYGLLMEVKGYMHGKDEVELEFTQSVSYPMPSMTGFQATTAYQIMNNGVSKIPIRCKLGEAVAIGGGRETRFSDDATGSIPYLRNVPVLRWLVSQDKNTFEDIRILTLISVRKMEGSSKIDPLSAQLLKMKEEDDEYYRNKEEKKVEPKKWYQFWKK